MHRRELLRVLGAAAALPMLGALTVEELLAAGATLHARRRPSGALGFHALTAHEGATVAALAEAIIPTTDTPGAIAAGVPEFIDLIVAEWYDDEERAEFRSGLRDVDARSRRAHGADFVAINASGRADVLGALEADAKAEAKAEAEATPQPDSRPRPRPAPFFKAMKYLTLWGYYTSEVGAVQETGYETIPGQFNGCVPILAPDGT